MRARLTDIRLQTGDRLFEIGEEVVGGEDLPMELLAARLAAGTAVLVLLGDEPGPELQAAIDAFVAAQDHLSHLLVALVDTALAGPAGSARAVMAAIGRASLSGMALAPRLAELEQRAEADQLLQAQDPERGLPAASEAGDVVGRASPAELSQDAPPQTAGRQGEAEAPAPVAPMPSSTAAKKPAARKKAAGKAG